VPTPESVADVLFHLYERLGLLNSVPGLIVANAANAIPFGILVLRSFMLGVPPSIVEAVGVSAGDGHTTELQTR